MTTVQVASVEEIQALVRDAWREAANGSGAKTTPGDGARGTRRAPRVRAVAGRTKTALSAADDEGSVTLIDVSGIAGVRSYSPAECTFTAGAGTRVAEIEAMLAADGLYLPFEPPFAARGATLGGTVAAGLSGAGRFRYGGVRDFLLGARFIDGEGRLVRGGGQVVKNAAGFYLQHLQLGALGRLGVLAELTFKVFPQTLRQVTLVADLGTRDRAFDGLVRLRQSTFEIDALELVPPSTLYIRLGGTPSAIDARAAGLTDFLRPETVRALSQEEAAALWADEREFGWLEPSASLVKVAITPSRLTRLDDRLGGRLDDRLGDRLADGRTKGSPGSPRSPEGAAVARRYGAGGEAAWIAWPGALAPLDRLLTDLALSGVVLTRGSSSTDAPSGSADPLIGVRPDETFLTRVRAALDPRGLFT